MFRHVSIFMFKFQRFITKVKSIATYLDIVL